MTDQATPQPTHYLVPAGLLRATLDYLAKRPFVEVADAILALRSVDPAPTQPVKDTATAER